MKRLMFWEIVVLVLLAAAAVWALLHFLGAPAPADPDDATIATDTTISAEATQPTDIFTPTWNTYPQDRKLQAKQYFVYDCKANTFLASTGVITTKVYPASITKLFTAYVAMQYLDLTTKITAGDVLELVAIGSSVANIRRGNELTVEQLIEAMLLPSGNDAAYMLACEVGWKLKGTTQIAPWYAVQAFVAEMNVQAEKVGMTGTHFTNPDGVHNENHYSTYADLAILGKLSLENATIMKYANTPRETVYLQGKTWVWKNTNKLIDPTSSYYCPYAVGLKTGQTPSAGSCLLSAFRYEDKELIIGVFGCPTVEDRFDDTLQLFNRIVLK